MSDCGFNLDLLMKLHSEVPWAISLERTGNLSYPERVFLHAVGEAFPRMAAEIERLRIAQEHDSRLIESAETEIRRLKEKFGCKWCDNESPEGSHGNWCGECEQ